MVLASSARFTTTAASFRRSEADLPPCACETAAVAMQVPVKSFCLSPANRGEPVGKQESITPLIERTRMMSEPDKIQISTTLKSPQNPDFPASLGFDFGWCVDSGLPFDAVSCFDRASSDFVLSQMMNTEAITGVRQYRLAR
eukprot:m.247832 g.247832  ORF g.247832 m.247832 type:complete len:142 (-) comp26662_c0_seq11:584-1009(-)